MIHGIERIFTGIFLMVVGFLSITIGASATIVGLVMPERSLSSDLQLHMSPSTGVATFVIGALVLGYGYLRLNQNDG